MKRRNESNEPGVGIKALAAFFVIFGVCVVLVSVGAMFYGFAVKPFIDAEHCRQVFNNPVTVTGIVVDHGSYSTEDGTCYQSFINYSYDGVYYQRMEYEDFSNEEQLSPIGTEVTLQVSPKNPAKQIKDLKYGGIMLWFTGVIVSLLLTAACVLLPRSKLTKGSHGVPDPDTMRRDMKIKIRSRMFRPFFLIFGLSYGILYWRYSMLVGKAMLIIAAVCGVCWLASLLRAIQDYRHVDNGDFEIRRDVLVDKKEISDSDSTSYFLYYQSGEQKWNTSTTWGNYRKAQMGDTVVAVYLSGYQNPIVHYSCEGNAK